MNQLEPWKIWAVTAALVCAILGSTAARVRPQAFDEALAWAAAVDSGQRSPSVTTTSPDTSANQYEAYPSYTPHRSFSDAGYSGVKTRTIIPLNNPSYGSATASAVQAEYYQEPVIDVTQQILNNQDSTGDLVAVNDGQSTHNWDLPLSYSVDVPTPTNDFVTDGWVYPAVRSDLAFNTAWDVASLDGYRMDFSDSSVPTDVQASDLALTTAIINVAINGSDTNGTVNPVPFPVAGYLTGAEQPVVLDSVVVNTVQNLALAGEFNEELGDEQEVLDEARTQALGAEVQAEAQAQLQAALQQRTEAVYTVTFGRVNVQINGVQFTDPPQE